MTKDEDEIRERFTQRYSHDWDALHRRIEQDAIGADWGANGYTTRAQADRILDILGLSGQDTLLDLGAGRGWPGLYFSSVTGCSVIALDLPPEGLTQGRRRAAAEGLGDRFLPVVASAGAPPLRPKSVDAVVASDVFC